MSLLRRLSPDPFVVALLATVAVAALLPAGPTVVPVLDRFVAVAIGVLFFLCGAPGDP
jgi:sodium/bile acid cotransporter 7